VDPDRAIHAASAAIESAREEVVATLQALIAVPSVNPDYPHFEGVPAGEGTGETAAQAILRPVYEKAGCDIDQFEAVAGRANLVGVLRGTGGRGARSLILNGHVDTVAPGDPADWASGDPFDGRIAGGEVYGLGASDMKSGLVAQAWAVRAISAAGIRLRGDLIVESVVGEEEMDHRAGVTATIERGYRADAAIVAEPTSSTGRPTLAPCSGGATDFVLRIEGRTAHNCARGLHVRAGGERHAVNAIDKAFLIAGGISELEAEWRDTRTHPLFPPGSFTIGPNTISGTLHGQAFSWAVADQVRLEYLVMYEPTRLQAEVRAEVEARLERIVHADPWLSEHHPSIEWPHTWPPYDTPVDHPIVSAVSEAHRQALGDTVELTGFAAVDDATFFQAAGIPAVTYGPGSILTSHCLDERVPIEDVIRAAKVYAATAIEWCGVA
jgi:acetylornithine deacetylase/succinyl-diaminopimelate desuccinylase family protein